MIQGLYMHALVSLRGKNNMDFYYKANKMFMTPVWCLQSTISNVSRQSDPHVQM